MFEKQRCLIIAEVAQSHDGSLGLAHSFVDAAAKAGAGAIKFQTHIAAAESTLAEPWRVKFSRQDATRFDYWRRMEFTEEQWVGLKQHADDAGIQFLSSPFSPQAVALLQRVGVPAWKVASGEVSNHQLLDAMITSGAPILLSSGMSSWSELDEAVARIKAGGNELLVMQCTSEYPCGPENVGLNLLSQMRERYNCPVGLSDHSGRMYASLAAAALGANALEVHVTFSREMFGPDVPSSLTFEELRQLVDGVHFIETALVHPVDKDRIAAQKLPMRAIFGKSIVAAEDLAAGTVLEERHLAMKKPGTGLPPAALASLVGRRLLRTMSRDEQMLTKDIE